MKIGFTGTQRGWTIRQRESFRSVITNAQEPITEFHHGDCVGADMDAHDEVRILLPNCTIVIHPPINDAKRAFCIGDIVMPEASYEQRNRQIVVSTQYLIATPKEDAMQVRSGTWATVRFARGIKREGLIILPDGIKRPLTYG